MENFSIRRLLSMVRDGMLRIPTFQRGFVWDAEQVAFLMDSIYKGYPIGSLLIWRTREQLDYDRKLGPFQLPEPKAGYPIDYLLDGQQRVTSIFGVFQMDIEKDTRDAASWMNIYFDAQAEEDAQDSQFIALRSDEADPQKHFPLKLIFDVSGYGKALREVSEEFAEKIYKVQAKFTEAQIPAEILSTDDKATVAIVFERVNRRGVPLDTLQLLTAWTWSQDFHLQKQFENLTEQLKPFGFHEVGEGNLLTRCCAAVLAGDASTEALINLNGNTIRSRFTEVENGITGAIEFLQKNLYVYSLDNLPYSSLLIPLSVFFATTGNKQIKVTSEQRSSILHWFWRTCFTKRYNSQPAKTIQADIDSMTKLKNGDKSSLDGIAKPHITADLFKYEQFRINNVTTKTFVLMLAQKRPYSFISGNPVSLAKTLKSYNKNEFHHLYPKAFLKTQTGIKYDVNCLANFSFMSRADNNELGGAAPSIYKAKLTNDSAQLGKILMHSLCYPSTLFADDFNSFIDERAQTLANEANRLMG